MLPFRAPGVRRLMGGAPQNERRKYTNIWRGRGRGRVREREVLIERKEDAVGDRCVIF